MSFPTLAAGSAVFLVAAVFCFSKESGPIEANGLELTVPADNFASSLISLNSDQLDQRISVQQHIIEINQALLDELQIPEPIYATERSALPVNKQEIVASNADSDEYSAALTTAQMKLQALLDAKEQLDDE